MFIFLSLWNLFPRLFLVFTVLFYFFFLPDLAIFLSHTLSFIFSLAHSFDYFLFRSLSTHALSPCSMCDLSVLSLSLNPHSRSFCSLSLPPCFYHWSPRYSSLSNYSCASLSYFIVIRVSLLVLSLKFLSLFLCVWIPLSLDIWSLCVSLKYVSVCVSSFLARRSRIISLLLLGTRRFGWRLQMYKRGSVWWKTRK